VSAVFNAKHQPSSNDKVIIENMKLHTSLISASWFAAALILSAATAKSALALVDQGDTTFDPNTGLVWLDLTFTQGQSYNSILNGAGGFTTSLGYRFASVAEVNQLFVNAGAITLGTPLNPPISVNVPAAQQALSLLGCTLPMANVNRSWMFYDPASAPAVGSPPQVPTAVFGEGLIGGGYIEREGFFMTPGTYEDKNYASSELASALVRLVPEPSCPMLLGAAVALMLTGRKR